MITNYFLEECLRRLGGLSDGSCYLGLSKQAPTEDGQGAVEPVGNGYERVLLNSSNSSATGHLEIGDDGKLTNKDIIYLGEATGTWGTLTHYCLYSAKTGGNMLAYGELTEAISVETGTVPLIRVGEIKISISRSE